MAGFFGPAGREAQFREQTSGLGPVEKYGLQVLVQSTHPDLAPLHNVQASVKLLFSAASFLSTPFRADGRASALHRMGEMYVAEFPIQHRLTLVQATNALIDGGKVAYNAANTAMQDAARAQYPEADWLLGTDMTTFDLDATMWLLNWFSNNMEATTYATATSEFATVVCALCKQGNTTSAYLTKIATAIRDELEVNAMLNSADVRSYWIRYGRFFTDAAAQTVFASWERWCGEAALRIRITIQQAKGQGLTCIQAIIDAVMAYQDFPWGLVKAKVPGQWTAAQQARLAIRNQPYYGYKTDLGIVKSTNYSDVAYVCLTLLERCGGALTYREYRGLNNRTIRERPVWDTMIQQYISRRTDMVSAALKADAEASAGLDIESAEDVRNAFMQDPA